MRPSIHPSAMLTAAITLAALAVHVSAATSCPAGYYSSTGQTPCSACPAGTYQSQTGSRSCTSAQAGWHASGTGNTAQTQCGAGYYSTGGAAACTICPAGTYCNSNTQTSPQNCEPGRYSASPGATQDCANCPAGTFNNVYGATSCCSCCSGWYTDQTGQTHCFNCPNKGSFQQGYSPVGSTSSSQCIAAAGALSSCSQSSDGTCPSTGGAVASHRRRSPNTPEFCEKPGYKSCPVWNSVLENTGHGSRTTSYKYECVNIANDIWSCGGCVDDPASGKPSPDGGRDCSAIPHVDDVTCSNGSCKIQRCSKGYKLSVGQTKCIPAPRHHRKSAGHGHDGHSHDGHNL